MNIKIALLSAACVLALSACGDGSTPPADSTATPAETAAPPAETAPAPDATTDAAPAHAGAGSEMSSDPVASGCEIEIESNDAMQFNTRSITVPASCSDFTITLHHVGQMPVAAMGHNVVITTADDMAGVVSDGMAAGLEQGFLKPDDERVIAATEMIGGGETTSVTFAVGELQGGDEYRFFCSFPGHSALMNGTISVE